MGYIIGLWPTYTRILINIYIYVCTIYIYVSRLGSAGYNTVDERNSGPVDMENLPLFTGFYTCQVVQEFFHQQYIPFLSRWNNPLILTIDTKFLGHPSKSSKLKRWTKHKSKRIQSQGMRAIFCLVHQYANLSQFMSNPPVVSTVDGSEIRRAPVEGKVVYPFIYKVYTFQVVGLGDFWTINSSGSTTILYVFSACVVQPFSASSESDQTNRG